MILALIFTGAVIANAQMWRLGNMVELCGGVPCEDLLGGTISKRPTEFKTNIAEQKTEGHSGTTLKVSSITTKDGNTLDPSVLGSLIVLSVNPSASNAETVVCTGLTTSTKTFTGCTFGYRFDNPTATSSANIKAHSPGEPVIISNTDTYEAQKFVTIDGDTTITASNTVSGQWDFPTLPYGATSTPTDQRQFITLYQFQQATTTGGINGSETAKGVYEGATPSEMALGTEFGSTGASLVALGKYLSWQGGTFGRIPVSTSTGYIHSSWGGVALSLATLNSGGLVVENPASARVIASTSSIPLTSATTSTLNGSWFGTTTPGSVFYVGSDGYATSLLNGVFGQVLKTNSTNTTTAMTAPEWAYSGLIFATTTNVSLSGTGTQTVLTTQIPANVLKRGSAIRVKGQMTFSNSSGSNKTYTPAVQYGNSSGVCAFGGMLTTSLGGAATMTFECVIQYVDATNQEGFSFSVGSDSNGVFSSSAVGTGTTTPASAQNLSILNNTSTGSGEGSLNSLTIEVY